MTRIAFEGVYKSFSDVKALSDVTFEVFDGSSTGILGPNGSGKTTLMKILTGLLRPDSGRAMVNDISVEANSKEAMRHVGSLIEQPEFYTYLSGYETLEFACRIRGLGKQETKTEIGRVSQLTGCSDYLHRRTGGYSRGMKQRLGLSIALAGDPEILVLDEPTFGLDPKGMKELGDLILDMRKTKTILFSTHLLSEARTLCDRIIIMESGRMKYDSKDDPSMKILRIKIDGRINNIPELSSFGSYSFTEDSILINKNEKTNNYEIIQMLVSNGIKIDKVEDYDTLSAKYLSVVEKGS
ncbi:MAG: ABC transporter ATP-binding protein [Thermoplasmataceae archaeon]|nr:ABC transporter ATP-binding protein [Candidatus Thermoplasmatota archaeon]